MPLRIGIPYQPYSFLIKNLDGRIIAQDDKGRIRYSNDDAELIIEEVLKDLKANGGGDLTLGRGKYSLKGQIDFPTGIGNINFKFENGAYLERLGGTAIYISSTSATPSINIINPHIVGEVGKSGVGIRLSGSQYVNIINPYITKINDESLDLSAAKHVNIIRGKIKFVSYEAIAISESHHIRIRDTEITRQSAAYHATAIIITGAGTDDYLDIVLDGLKIHDVGNWGIRLVDAWGVEVINSELKNIGLAANNTYDVIELEADVDTCELNRVKGNTIWSDQANKPKYGVDLAGADNNFVVYNTIKNYVTGAINDAGIGNTTTPNYT